MCVSTCIQLIVSHVREMSTGQQYAGLLRCYALIAVDL